MLLMHYKRVFIANAFVCSYRLSSVDFY